MRPWFPLLFLAGAACAPSSSAVLDGLRATKAQLGGQDCVLLELSDDDSMPIAVGILGVIYLEDGARRWSATGMELSVEAEDKRATWGFEDVVTLRPGMKLALPYKPRTGATLVLDVGRGYEGRVEDYFRSRRIRLWTGRVTLE